MQPSEASGLFIYISLHLIPVAASLEKIHKDNVIQDNSRGGAGVVNARAILIFCSREHLSKEHPGTVNQFDIP